MRLVAVVRVSTEEQAATGHSLDAQERAIRSWCEAMGHELVSVHRGEGESGKSLDRPSLQAAFAALEDADGLVCLKLDRLTRSGRDFYELVERFEAAGKALVSVRDSLDTTTPSGRLVANIMVAVSQWEREAIAERVREGMAEARRQGKHLGRPRVEHPAWVLERVRELRAADWSLAAIAGAVTGEGHPCSLHAVRRMLLA